MRTRLLSKTDRAHLEQTRGELPDRLRVRLCASQDDDAVGLERDAIDVCHGTGFRRSELDRLHGRAYGRSGGALVDAKAAKNFRLPFRGRAAMAAHRRNNER